MDLASLDKLAKDHKRVKYLVVGQDLFDRTVDAKGEKQRTATKLLEQFQIGLQKRIDPRNFGLTQVQSFLESFKNFAAQQKYKFILQ